ncbi:MAG: hypothetical protein HKO93_00290 [Flavobacteriales bacterium]|nr:hypothetical protein [Flavobacteriales bacterium]
MSKKQKISALLMLVVLIVLGGFRDIVFVNINEQIGFNDGLVDSNSVLDSFSFLKSYPTEKLLNLKWALTVLFAIAFFILSFISFKYILDDSQGARWMSILYLAGVITSGVMYIGGKVLGDPLTGYTLSRVIMGALQSPFPLMLMIPARMLVDR